MSVEESGKVVCVTGASGFIASWLVKLLLHKGYTVKATVRDPNDPKKTEHLRELPGANERLHLFKATLLDEGSFDSIIDGCEGVFHTASPCYFETKDPQAELIDPAVKGTLNALRSCAKTPSVRRVIVTSSISAVLFNGRPRSPEIVVDETWFSDPEFCRESKLWYALSKTLAEQSAWEFAKDHGIDMIVINPSMVAGPLLQPTLNSSAETILSMISGAETYSNTTFGWVNVRDVANAHILAFEVPSASGRYCVVGEVAHYSEIVQLVCKLYPDIQIPERCSDGKPFVPTYQVSKEKVKSLGLDFTPMEVSIREIIESLKDKKFFSL